MIPAALTLLPPPAMVPARLEEGGWFARFVAGCGALSMRHRWFFLPFFVVLLAVGAMGITRLRIETDYLRFFSVSHPVRVDNERVSRSLAGTQVVSVVVDAQGPESVTRSDTIEAMRALQHFIDQQPGVDRTLSLLDQLDSVRTAVSPARVGAPFTDQAEIAGLLNLLAPHDVRHEVNADHSRAQITVHTACRARRRWEASSTASKRTRLCSSRPAGGCTPRYGGAAQPLADALAWSRCGATHRLVNPARTHGAAAALAALGLLSMVPNVLPIGLLRNHGLCRHRADICTTRRSLSIGSRSTTRSLHLGFYDELRGGHRARRHPRHPARVGRRS